MKKYIMLFMFLLIVPLTLILLFLSSDATKVTDIISVNQLSKVQSVFEDISLLQNDEYFDEEIKFSRFDLAFNDGVFVNLSFTILETEKGRHSKYYQLITTGELIETRGFEVADTQYIPSKLVCNFFEAVDNNKLLDELNIDKTKNINFIYSGKLSFTEDDTQKKDVYVLKNNNLKVLTNNNLRLEQEYYLFQLVTNNRVIYIAI